jgi:hypothetical protein
MSYQSLGISHCQKGARSRGVSALPSALALSEGVQCMGKENSNAQNNEECSYGKHRRVLAMDPFKGRPVAQSKRFRREDETSLRMMIRDLIRLARENLSVELIASRKKAVPAKVLVVAKRLGVHLPRIAPRPDGEAKK